MSLKERLADFAAKHTKRGSSTIGIAIDLIIFAALGLLALILLATSSTTGLSPTVAFLAITFVSLMAILGVAVGFMKKAGINVDI